MSDEIQQLQDTLANVARQITIERILTRIEKAARDAREAVALSEVYDAQSKAPAPIQLAGPVDIQAMRRNRNGKASAIITPQPDPRAVAHERCAQALQTAESNIQNVIVEAGRLQAIGGDGEEEPTEESQPA